MGTRGRQGSSGRYIIVPDSYHAPIWLLRLIRQRRDGENWNAWMRIRPRRV